MRLENRKRLVAWIAAVVLTFTVTPDIFASDGYLEDIEEAWTEDVQDSYGEADFVEDEGAAIEEVAEVLEMEEYEPADEETGESYDADMLPAEELIEDMSVEWEECPEEVTITADSLGEAATLSYEGGELSFLKADLSPYGMFTAMEGTSVGFAEGKVVVRYVPKNTTVYEGFYLNCGIDEISNEDETQLANRESLNSNHLFYALTDGAYVMELDLDCCGKMIPIAVIKNTFGKGSWTSAEQYYLAVPPASKIAEAITFEYGGEGVSFIKSDGEPFGMHAPQDGTTAVLSNDQVFIQYYPKNTSIYKGFYFNCDIGELDNTDNSTIANEAVLNSNHSFLTLTDNHYQIALDTSFCGKAWPIAIIKNTYGKGSWTSAEQYYLAIPSIEILTDQAAAAQVSAQLQVLNEDAGLDDKAAVEEARAAYDALTDAQKALVDPSALDKLKAAEGSVRKAEEAAKKAAEEAAKKAAEEAAKKAAEEAAKKAAEQAAPPAAGTVLTDGTANYAVETPGSTVAYQGPVSKKVKKVVVPNTVAIDGVTYTVDSIAPNAFKNCKNLTNATIPSNITSIGANAFAGTKNLKNVTIKSKQIKKIGKKAFYQSGSKNYKKLKVKVPKSKLKAYKKLLKNAKLSSKAKVTK